MQLIVEADNWIWRYEVSAFCVALLASVSSNRTFLSFAELLTKTEKVKVERISYISTVWNLFIIRNFIIFLVIFVLCK
jgi:hypothetical protein